MSLYELKDALTAAVASTLPESNVAIAFSGGIDSTLLSVICRDLGKDVRLVTVGFPDSHDILFSRSIAQQIGLPQVIVELDKQAFQSDLKHVTQIVTCGNTSHIENCVAYHYIAQAARNFNLSVVASANGCDELFCGYNGYRSIYEGGESAILEYMDLKIKNELVLIDEISLVASEFSVQIRQPFLSRKFIEFAKERIPIDQKIKGKDDLMRKHILRHAAMAMGVPKDSALKPKKALQYGSLIHKNYKRQTRHEEKKG